MLFASLPIHTRQTCGVVAAVVGVIAIKASYVYSLFTDPEAIINDFQADPVDEKKEK